MASRIDYLLTGNRRKSKNTNRTLDSLMNAGKKETTAQTETTSAPEVVSTKRRQTQQANAMSLNRTRNLTKKPEESVTSQALRLATSGTRDATKSGIAATVRDFNSMYNLGMQSTTNKSLMNRSQLEELLESQKAKTDEAKQKEDEFKKLTDDQKQELRNEAQKTREVSNRLSYIADNGLPVYNFDGEYAPVTDETWRSGNLPNHDGERLFGRPEDYDDNRFDYDTILYDTIYGDGAYEARQLAEDYDSDILHAELDQLWDAIENNGEMYSLASKARKEADDKEYASTGDFGYNKYYEAQKSAEEALARLTDIEQWQMHAPTAASGDYNPDAVKASKAKTYGWVGLIYGDQTDVHGNETDEIYYFANNLPTSDMSELEQYNSLKAAMMMSDEQRDTFNRYYNHGMYKEAQAYYDALKPYLNAALTTTKAMYEKDMSTNENAWNMIIRRVFTGPAAGVAGAIGTVAALFGDKTAKDPNSEYWQPTATNASIVAARAAQYGEVFANVFGENGRKYGELIGNALYSIADNVVATVLTAGTGAAIGKTMADKFSRGMLQFVMSTEATAGAMKERLDDGQDPTQAALFALGSGVVEAITEKYSIEALFNMNFKGLLRDKSRFLSYVGKNFFVEGTEEVAADLLNNVWDGAVSLFTDSTPEMMREYEALAAQYGPEEARRMVIDNFKEKLFDSFLAGGFSGLIMSSGYAGINTGMEYVQDKEIGRNVREYNLPTNATTEERTKQETENIRRLITTAGKMQTNSKSKQQADAMQAKLDDGKKVTNVEIANLTRSIMEESGEKVGEVVNSVLKSRIQQDLESNGASKGNAKNWAGFVTKAVLTSEAKTKQLMETEQGQIARELIKDDIRKSGATAGLNEESVNQLAEMGAVISLGMGVRTKTAAAIVSHVSVRDTLLDYAKNTELKDIAGKAVTEIKEQNAIQDKIGEMMTGDVRKATNAVSSITKGAKTVSKTDLLMAKGKRTNSATEAVYDGQIVDVMGILTKVEDVEDEVTGKKQKQSVAYAVLSDGTTVRAGDVQAVNPEAAKLLQYSTMRTNSAINDRVMSVLFKNAENIKNADSAIADAAKVTVRTVLGKETGDTRLGATLQEQVEKAALEDFNEAEQKRTESRREIKPGQGIAMFNGEKIGTEAFKAEVAKLKDKAARRDAYIIGELAQSAGFDVEFYYDPEDNGNYGQYSGKNGVRINLAAVKDTETGMRQSALAIFAHEITHQLEANSPEEYRKLRSFVINRMEMQGVNVEQRLQNVVKGWRASGDAKIDLYGAVAEMVANGCDQILTNRKVVTELRESDPTLFGKVQSVVRNLINRMKAALGDLQMSKSYESQNMMAYMDELSDLWLGAFREAKGTKGTAAESAEVQNSIQEDLDKKYADAVEREDWRTAENMLLEKMQQTAGITGYRAPNFYNGEHKTIAKMIKENYGDAVARAVEDMAPMVPENAVLIPMPPHEGKVLEDTDTMILAKALGEATGMPVVVALESDPHTSRNVAKMTGDRTVTAESMGFRQIAEIPEGSMPVFVDNMVGGGTTATAAKNAIGRGITLAYAQSARAKSLGVKDVSVTYDSNGKLIPLSKRMDPTNKSYKYSFRETSSVNALDAEYEDAVKNNDSETQEMLVSEAAANAGYNIEGYHGTDAKFTVFKKGDIGFHIGSIEQATDRINQAGMRSWQNNRENHVMHLFAKLENPLVVDHDFGDWHGKNVAEMLLETEQFEEGFDKKAEEINAKLREIAAMPDGAYTDKVLREYLQSLGYDGIDYENQFENVDRNEYGWAEDFDRSYIVFDANQLKSADPIVYDDQGNVIPLSERFNPESKDIRYSVRELDDHTKYVSIDTDQNIFEGHDEKEYRYIARKYIVDHFKGTTVGEKEKSAYVDRKSADHYAFPAKKRGENMKKLLPLKMRAATELDNMMKASEYKGNSGYDDDHPEFPGGFDQYDVTFVFNENDPDNIIVFTGTVQVGLDSLYRKHFYDLTKLKIADPAGWVNRQKTADAQRTEQRSTDNIASVEKKSNTMRSVRENDITLKSLDIPRDYAFKGSDEEIDAAEEKIKQRMNEIRKIVEKNGFAGLELLKKNGQTEILTPSIRPGVRFQLSYFDRDGIANMHENYGRTKSENPVEEAIHTMNELYRRYASMSMDEDITFRAAEEGEAERQAVQQALDNPKKQFSMREPVEAKDNGLIAVHNLAEEQLIKTIRLGGFPMPSIAIVKDDYAHDRYGDISVIFYSDTIDPKKTKLNKVYSGDAWTPTYPYVEYKLSKKVLDKVVKKVESLIPRNILQDLTFSSLDETNLTKSVNSARGDIVQAAKDNKKLKLAYLVDTGKTIEYPMREKKISTRFTNEMVEKIAQTLGRETAEEAYMGSSSWFDENPEIVEKIRNVVAGIWEEEVKAKLGAEKSKLKIANMNPYSKENWGFSHNYSAIEGAWKYFNRGIEQELDEHALDEIINKEINEEKYEQWLRDQFAGIIEKSGIRNNKDFYTNYGTPRSWEALHDEETIENVVRIMKAEVDKGANAFFGQSAMLALGTRDFKSLDDIRKHSDQLKHISEEEMSEAKTTIVNGFSELMDEMMNRNERNVFIARDQALEAMVDAVRTSKTAEGIMRVLKEYGELNVPADAGERIVELLHEIENLPTEYFEAKPQRAVGLNEIASAIIPEQASNELVQLLKANNIPYKMYDGTNEDRLKKVNSVENVKFSFREEVDYNVRQWLESVNVNNLRSEVEKQLVSNYRDLEISIRLDMERERNLKQQIAEIEKTPEDQRSAEQKRVLQKLNVRLENVGHTKAAKQKKMAAITGQKGFGKLMQEQNRIFNDNIYGRTQAEVNEIVLGMEENARRIEERVEAAKAEVAELEKSNTIQTVKKILGATTADMAVDQLKKRFHSSWTKKELRTFFDPILVKMNAGEDFSNEVQELADVLVRSNQELVYEGLSALQGLTITIGRGQKQELKGTNSSLNEIRDRLAGTGIKVKYGKYSSLEGDIEDLRAEFPGMPELGDEKDSLENFVSWVEGMKNQFGVDEYYSDYLADAMAAVMEIAARTASDSGLYVPKDAKARKQITDLVDYIRSLKTRTETAEKSLAEISDLMREIREAGTRAAGMSGVVSNNMAEALKYYDTIAKLAMEEAKKQKQSAIIDQLKSDHAKKILKINEQWRQLLERNDEAYKQAEENRKERGKINTDIKRMYHLLKDQTTQKNMPEYMKALARYTIKQIVWNDAFEKGARLTKADKEQLAEAMRLLSAWDIQDGPAEYTQIMEGLQDAEEVVGTVIANDIVEIDEALKDYNSEIRGKNHLDTLQQRGVILKRLSAAVSEIYQAIQAEREVQANGRKIKTENQAFKVRQATKNRKFAERTGKAGRAMAAMKKAIVSGNMTPEYFFRMIGNEGLNDLWENYHQAENRNGLELAKAQNRLKEIADKHGYKNWDTKEKVTIKLGGKNIEMTVGQLMSLYATWKREQQLGPAMSEHLTTGGFYVEKDLRDGILGKEVMEKKAHRIIDDPDNPSSDVDAEGNVPAIENALTKEQKEFVDEVVGYMSSDLSEMGNEASMIAYGIKLYKEKYYFPFQIWDGVKNRKSNDAGQGANADRAFHPSFAKSRLHGANNALIMGDFMQTAADHIAGMINYATIGLANESLQKVLNFQLKEGGETPEGYDIYDVTKRNIRAVLEEAYGQEALQYLLDLQKQLNGGAVKVDKSFYDKLISIFRKNAVAGSLSVAAQQPLSYIRAAVMIDPKYLAAALNPTYWKGSYKEMMDHSGVAVIKDMGRFDVNFGQSAREYLMPEGKQGKVRKNWELTKEYATILPEMADRATWTRMWSAVKIEQHDLHPEMDMKSDEFLDICGERFNDIMRRTQVYDSMLVKSANMRNQNVGVKMLTSFMAEPTLSLNVLADAVRSAKAGEKGSGKLLIRAGTTFLLSAVLQAAIKALFSTGRTPDEKKTQFENWMYRFGSNVISEVDPLQLLPGYNEVLSVFKDGKVNDDAMGMLGKLYTSGKDTVSLLLGKGWEDPYRAIEDSVGQVTQLISGLPAKNIMRDLRASFNLLTGKPYATRETNTNVLNHQFWESFFNADNAIGLLNDALGDAGYDTSVTGYKRQVYEAIKEGNDEKKAGLIDYLLKGRGVKDEKSINSAVKGFVKEDYKNEKIERKQAEELLKKATPDIKQKDIMKILDEIDYETETGEDVDSYSVYIPLREAIDKGNSAEITKETKHLTSNGYDEKEVSEQIKSYITSQYKDGKYTKTEAASKLQKYRPDMDADDIFWTLDRIEYQQKTGKTVSGTYYRLYDAMDANKAADITSAIKSLLDHGTEVKSIKSQLTSKYKQEYLKGSDTEKVKIRDAMEKAYKALGLSAEEADNVINKWK